MRGVGEGFSDSGHALGAAARVHEHAAGVLARRARSRWPGVTPGDVDVLTVYDPFTVVSLMQIEDMGFCPKGEAGAFVEGDTLFHDAGKLPFNTHGGLLSHAYVLGIAHVVECVKQLRGTAPRAGARLRGRGVRRLHRPQASTLVLSEGSVTPWRSRATTSRCPTSTTR